MTQRFERESVKHETKNVTRKSCGLCLVYINLYGMDNLIDVIN